MTPLHIAILIIDLLSVMTLISGLLLRRRLSIHRHAFLSVLQVDRHIPKPRLMGVLPWIYVFIIVLILLVSALPFLRSLLPQS